MKKLLALLAVCTMMTCAFASCGNDKADESSAEKSVSVSESEAETTEPETEEDTTEEETTEPETEEETTESTSAEATEESIIGMWSMEMDGNLMGFKFKEDGNADMFVNLTDSIHFTSDGKFFMDSVTFEPDCIQYDGTMLTVTIEEDEILTMAKDSGSPDSFDGVYTLLSGRFYDSMAEVFDYSDIYVVVNGETLYIGYRNLFAYTADDTIVTMSGLSKIGYNGDDSVETTYEIKDGTLTLKEFEDDENWVMTKFDFSDDKKTTSSESSVSGEKTTSKKTSSDKGSVSDKDRTTEGSIIGSWYSTEDTYGFSFDEDGTGGVFVDASEMVHFTTDGKFFISSMTLEPENIQYDGTKLSINVQGTDMLTMTRNDGSNPDSFDGEYTFVSGAFYDGMVSSMGESFGIAPEEAVVYAVVDGEEMYVKFAKLFTYSADNGSLVFEGLEGLGIPDGSVIVYEFAGNNLIITNGNNEEMILENIDL